MVLRVRMIHLDHAAHRVDATWQSADGDHRMQLLVNERLRHAEVLRHHVQADLELGC